MLHALRASLLAGAVALAAPASAMEYSYRLHHKQIVVDAVGKIEANEIQLYAAWLQSQPAALAAYPIVAIVFNSPGGNPVGAAQLGDLIQHFRMRTGVAGGGQCASACVFAWGAGALKSAAPDSHIGVHQPELVLASGQFTPADAKALLDLTASASAALARLGAPESVIQASQTVPPTSVYWLTPDDLAAWNVRVTR